MSKGSGYVPIDKNLIQELNNIGRPFTRLEAMFSYTIDQNNGKGGSINGYASCWNWSRNKARKFLKEIRTVKGHQKDSERDTTNNPNPIPNPDPILKSKEKDLKPIVLEPEIPFKEIIEYLNLKTRKHYQHTTPKTQGFIKARWNEGFKSLDDYKHVIDVKCVKWLNTEDEKYLRPETLFGTKFEGYLNERIIENPHSSQIPKAITVYQADMLQKEAVNQEYLRQRRQEENEESNSRHQDVIDIEDSPRPID